MPGLSTSFRNLIVIALLLISAVVRPAAAGAERSLKWTFEADTGSLNSSPAITEKGVIYVGSSNGIFYAIEPDGRVKWTFDAGYFINSAPVIGPDGSVYFVAYHKTLFAMDPKGNLKWKFGIGRAELSCPAIGSDGTLYFSSTNGNLYAINSDRTQKWILNVGSRMEAAPVIGSDGTIYIGAHDYNIYAVNPDGKIKWTLNTGGEIEYSPAIGTNDTLYLMSYKKGLYAIKLNGEKKWLFEIKDPISRDMNISPAIGPDGTIYVSGQDSNLYAISPDGRLKWNFENESRNMTSPIVGSNGNIYVGFSSAEKFCALNRKGDLLWDFKTKGNLRASPAIGPDGTVYIACEGSSGSPSGHLYAFSDSIKGLADSPWPMLQNNTAHTGRVNSSDTGTSTNLPSSPFLRIKSVSGAPKSSIFISWSPVDTADGYNLYYASYPGADYVGSMDIGDSNAISFEIGNDIAFFVAVQAYNTSGEGPISNIEYFHTGSIPQGIQEAHYDFMSDILGGIQNTESIWGADSTSSVRVSKLSGTEGKAIYLEKARSDFTTSTWLLQRNGKVHGFTDILSDSPAIYFDYPVSDHSLISESVDSLSKGNKAWVQVDVDGIEWQAKFPKNLVARWSDGDVTATMDHVVFEPEVIEDDPLVVWRFADDRFEHDSPVNSGVAGEPVKFQFSMSYIYPAFADSKVPASVRLDWGDGETEDVMILKHFFTFGTEAVTHVYEKPGLYTVELFFNDYDKETTWVLATCEYRIEEADHIDDPVINATIISPADGARNVTRPFLVFSVVAPCEVELWLAEKGNPPTRIFHDELPGSGTVRGAIPADIKSNLDYVWEVRVRPLGSDGIWYAVKAGFSTGIVHPFFS